METRANYVLIGLFTLAVILAGFAFGWWKATSGKTAAPITYQVNFSGSVSGLATGAYVNYNGLRVGEVSVLGLRPDDPTKVYAKIDIRRAHAGQGRHQGAARIRRPHRRRLGGAARRLQDRAEPGAGSAIEAAPSQFQDLMAAAQKIAGKADIFLDKANKLLDDNASALTATAKNVEALTATLAEASGGISKTLDAVDPDKVRSILGNANSAVIKLNDMLSSGGGKMLLTNVSEAARSIKKLADNLAEFSKTGLKQYESLAVDGRHALESVDKAVRRLDKDPQSLLFGARAGAARDTRDTEADAMKAPPSGPVPAYSFLAPLGAGFGGLRRDAADLRFQRGGGGTGRARNPGAGNPAVDPPFDDNLIVIRTAGGLQRFGGAQWADSLPRLAQSRVADSLENAGWRVGGHGAARLQIAIRRFEVGIR